VKNVRDAWKTVLTALKRVQVDCVKKRVDFPWKILVTQIDTKVVSHVFHTLFHALFHGPQRDVFHGPQTGPLEREKL
jgi:hypothetical protein